MMRQTDQKETASGARRAPHGSEKEPGLGSSWRPESKMAPREESRVEDKSTAGTEERKLWGGSKPGDRSEGRGKAIYKWKVGGETLETSGGMNQLYAGAKMAPAPEAMLIPIQKGESPRGLRSDMKGAIRPGHTRAPGRSKSLPPHMGLLKVEILDRLVDSQKKYCDKSAKKAKQEESHGVPIPPPILQLHEEGGWTPESYVKSSDRVSKTGKNGERRGHIRQHEETQRKEKQLERAAPKGAMMPQKDKIFPTTSRAAKKKNIRGLRSSPFSSSGIQPPRPKSWPSKVTKLMIKGREKRLTRHHYPSRPLYTGDSITSSGPPLRHQVNLPSHGNKIDNNVMLLLYKDGENQFTVLCLEMNRGTWPPGRPWPSWDEYGTLALFVIYPDRCEAVVVGTIASKEVISMPFQGPRAGGLHDMINVG